MNFQIDATPALASSLPAQPVPPPAPSELTEVLKQILEVQKEQVAYLRALLAAHDAGARWRAFLARWEEGFPHLADDCRQAMPHLEQGYAHLVSELAERLTDEDESLDNDFRLQEFLDRFGMRLAQLGTVLNLIGPLADAAGQHEGGRGASTS